VTRVRVDDPEEMASAEEQVREREKDLLWTDPDNPEAELVHMQEVTTEGTGRQPWGVSFTEGKRSGMRTGKPLVVWFTDSKRSPMCGALSAEVFSTAEFKEWAEDEVVRVRLDFSVKGENEDDRLRKRDYLEKLKERYRVLGTPAVRVMAPDGTVTGRYRGYQPSYGKFYFDRMKRDVEAARRHHEEWVAHQKRRGYRTWTDDQGRTLFAKLLRYLEGEMILAEPDGRRVRALERNLSAADRAWIEREKGKRL